VPSILEVGQAGKQSKAIHGAKQKRAGVSYVSVAGVKGQPIYGCGVEITDWFIEGTRKR
jgi:hypothetical protein